MATLSISKAGPASVAEGTEFTYTITYGNGGPDDAFNVEVRETLPAGAVLVSAGNAPGGIAPTIAGGMITWAIGTLPAAAMNQQVTVTVRAGCGITQIVNNNYTINGTPGGMVNGQSVTTQVTPTITDPVTMTIQSVDLNGGLLKEGEILQHTITLTNTASVLREGISVRGTSGGDFSAGYVSVFDAGIDAAGGQFVPNANDTALHWTGDLDPSATINIVFQTRVPDCISTQQSQEILNQGNLMTVRDGCNRQIGQATPTDLFTLQRRVVTRTLATNLTPPKTDSFLVGEAQLAREGSTLQFETVLMTDELTDVHGVTINLTIPADLMVNDPPFVGTPPAGATYNSAARTINLNGTVPAQGMVVIAWEGTIDPASKCRFELRGTGGTMECMPPTMNIDHTLTIFVVPELPAEPYLVTVDSFRGLSIMTPDVDTQGRDLFCKHGEIYSGITQTADGQIWVSGRPSLRFDPVNLECQTFEDDFFMNTLGVAFFTTGIGYDRFSDTLIFRGQGPTAGRVVRYDPAGGVATLILEDPVLNGFGACLVDQEAHVVVIGAGAGAIVRIDPANPQAFQLFNGSNLPEPAGVPVDAFHSMEDIALDVDGNYLLLVSSSWISGPNVLTQRWVAGLDRNSGIFSIVVENLAALHAGINGSDEIPTITVAPDGRFHFAQGVSSQPYHLYRTERACGNQTDYLGHAGVSNDAFVEFVSVEDMVYSDPVVDIGAVPTTTKGDFNADCLIDLADHTGFVDCLAGPDVAPAPTPPTTAQECLDVFDFDGDGDVDMEDEGAFFNLFN
jgi:uncharacterized repeat protein (TIGR01451 family)